MKKIIVSIFLLGAFVQSNVAFSQTDISGREPLYRATHTKSTELKHTKLKVSFDFDKEKLFGEEWLTASPYFYPSNQIELDAKSMIVSQVALEQNGNKTPLKFTHQNDKLIVTLDKVYDKNQDYTIYIKYETDPKLNKVGEGKGIYFINAQGKNPNKPVQIWTQGETEASSKWFPTIDKPNQKSTEEIYITVPDKYVTMSNGVLESFEKDAHGNRTDHWVMKKRHATYLFAMGIGDFAVIKDQWRNIPVNYYLEKSYADYGKQIFGNTPEMIEFFSKKLKYDYPWPKYSQMAVRDFVSGAMENTTATIHAEGVLQKPEDLIDENTWEMTIAHELFHHWFGDLVTAESWSNLTVNESFANYSEYLWLEYKYGKDAAENHLLRNSERYEHSGSFNKDLVRFNYEKRDEMFDAVSYNKGGAILHMLRNYLGDDAFFDGLNDYLKTNQYNTGEAHQLRLSFEKVSGKDLNWFFNQWYYGSGHPLLDIKYSYEPVKKQAVVTVGQNQSNYFQFPLAIDIHEGGKVRREHVWVDAKASNVFTFSVAKNPSLVNVNPDGVILSEIVEEKTPEQYFLQYTQTKDYYSRHQAIKKASEILKQRKDDFALKTIEKALKDSYFKLRILALSALDLTKPEQSHLIPIVEQMSQNDAKTLVQAEAIKKLTETKNAKYLPIYEKGINALSKAVKVNSLIGLAQISPEKVKGLLEKMDLKANNESDLGEVLLPIIVKNKIESKIPFIAEYVSFYPFLSFQNPELGEIAHQGFDWIMSGDYFEGTENIVKSLKLAKREIEKNVQVRQLIRQMVQSGLDLKLKVLRQNPKSENLSKQIDLLNEVLELYK